MPPRALIRNCSWKFRCSQSWDSLLEAQYYAYDRVRFCPDCKEKVYIINDESELFLAIEHDRCVAIPFDITNTAKQLDKVMLGSIKLDKGSYE